MAIFDRKPGQQIVVYGRRMFFAFEVVRREGGGYALVFQIPSRSADGSYAGFDTFEHCDVELEETAVCPFDPAGLPGGDVEITVLEDDGERIKVEVSVPQSWKAVEAETFDREADSA